MSTLTFNSFSVDIKHDFYVDLLNFDLNQLHPFLILSQFLAHFLIFSQVFALTFSYTYLGF